MIAFDHLCSSFKIVKWLFEFFADGQMFDFPKLFQYGIWPQPPRGLLQKRQKPRVIVISNKNGKLFMLKLSYSNKYLYQSKSKQLYKASFNYFKENLII